MKWQKACLGLALFGWLSTAAATQSIDTVDGFNGLRFGSQLHLIPGLTGRYLAKELVRVREGDPLSFEGVAVDAVGYRFEEDRLTGLLIVTRNLEHSRALFNALRQSYGEPAAITHADAGKFWQGNRTRMEFRVLSDDGFSVLRVSRVMKIMGTYGPRYIGTSDFVDYRGTGTSSRAGGNAPAPGDDQEQGVDQGTNAEREGQHWDPNATGGLSGGRWRDDATGRFATYDGSAEEGAEDD